MAEVEAPAAEESPGRRGGAALRRLAAESQGPGRRGAGAAEAPGRRGTRGRRAEPEAAGESRGSRIAAEEEVQAAAARPRPQKTRRSGCPTARRAQADRPPPKPEHERGRRQERRGIVVSDAMDKTLS